MAKKLNKEAKTQVTEVQGGHGKTVVKAATKKKKKSPVVHRKTDIVYPDFDVLVRADFVDEGELTVEEAKDLLGWQEQVDGVWPTGEKSEPYLFLLPGKRKVRCINNLTNRPFKPHLAKKYMNEILRKKWRLNGETLIFDRLGMAQSAQHRLIGFVMAEETRKADPTKWGPFWDKPITIPALIVVGVDESPDTVDTLDQCAKRNGGDVLYRNRFFKEVTDKEQAKKSRILGYAIRLVWLRSGGRTVSYAPHFPTSEMQDFLHNHERLLECVDFIWQLEAGKKKLVSTYVSLGYATALLYLMGAVGTEPEDYADVKNESAINWDLWEKAEEFWAELVTKNPALEHLRKKLINQSAGGAQGRDLICGMIIKAWNKWSDTGKTLTNEDIEIKGKKDPDTGFIEYKETPRLGGIDVEREDEESEE